mgnify:CR=1 FL=1
MQLKEILNEQRIYAILNKVPILRESEVHLFEELIGLYEPSRVLEVGTAIGYSTLLLAKHAAKDAEIVSIELDEQRHNMAKQYIGQSEYKDNITLHLGDANEVLTKLEGTFDLVFLDGPKGQYGKQLELIESHLAPGPLFWRIMSSSEAMCGAIRKHRTVIKRLLNDYVNIWTWLKINRNLILPFIL